MASNDVSTNMSWKGYSLKEWAFRNKDNFKAIIILLAGYNYLAGFSWQSLLIALGAIVGKCAIDSIDYYFSKVDLPS